MFFVCLLISASIHSKPYIEILSYFEKKMLFAIESLPLGEVQTRVEKIIIDEGVPVVVLYQENGSGISVIWVYVGDYDITDYYSQDIYNPFPKMLPISLNWKIKMAYNSGQVKLINKLGIKYDVCDGKVIANLNPKIIKKYIYPTSNLRLLEILR